MSAYEGGPKRTRIKHQTRGTALMPDHERIEQAEANLARVQVAIERAQEVLQGIDRVQQAAERTASALRIAAIGLAVGAAALGVTVAGSGAVSTEHDACVRPGRSWFLGPRRRSRGDIS